MEDLELLHKLERTLMLLFMLLTRRSVHEFSWQKLTIL